MHTYIHIKVSKKQKKINRLVKKKTSSRPCMCVMVCVSVDWMAPGCLLHGWLAHRLTVGVQSPAHTHIFLNIYIRIHICGRIHRLVYKCALVDYQAGRWKLFWITYMLVYMRNTCMLVARNPLSPLNDYLYVCVCVYAYINTCILMFDGSVKWLFNIAHSAVCLNEWLIYRL